MLQPNSLPIFYSPSFNIQEQKRSSIFACRGLFVNGSDVMCLTAFAATRAEGRLGESH